MLRDHPNLFNVGEYVDIEDFGSIGAVESFNRCVLIRVARLGITDGTFLCLQPNA